MSGKSQKKKVNFILILFLFLGLSTLIFGQDNQSDENKQLREEILAVYKSKGEQGLRDFVRKKKDKIPNKFIVDFAELGVKERKEGWLKVCEIIATEKKDEKTLADVFYNTGRYIRIISEYKKATDYFDQALHIYLKLNDTVGQGNVYLAKGIIYFYFGDNSISFEMYKKALSFYKKAKDPEGQGKVYFRKGNIYYIIGDNSRALEMYDKALPLFEKTGALLGQGNVYMGRGNIYLRIGKNSKAFEMYDKALVFFEKVRYLIGQGNVYRRKGNIYFYTGDNSKALKMYDKALPFFEKTGEPTGQGNVYLRKGMIYSHTVDNSKALEMYDKALIFFEKARATVGQGNVYKSKGNIYLRIGKNSKAFEMYDKALIFFEKAGAPLGQGNVYMSKGMIYSHTGYNSKAIEMYDKSLHFFEKAGEPLGQGNVYMSKGNIYFYTGDNSKALEMYNKALHFFEKAGEPIGQGNIYRRKGNVYFYTGDNSRALAMYDKALPFYKKAGQLIGQGNVYQRKGDIYLRIGDDSKAIEMYEKALPFFEKAKEPRGQGNTYMGKGDIYSILGENVKALEMYDKALHFFEKARYPIGQGDVYLNRGNIYFYTGNNLKSLDMYDKALIFFGKLGTIGPESTALHGKSKVLVKLGKKDEALELFEKGIANLEKVRTQTAFSEMKRTFMEKVYKEYEETVLFMLKNKYYDKGFKYAEAMRARVFLDRMGEGIVRIDKGLPHKLKEKRDNLVTKLSLLSKEIHKTAGKNNEKKLKELKEQYQKTENEFEELLIKIRLENPLYASVRYTQPVSFQNFQKEVLREGEILVRYFISPNKLYVFLVSKKKFKVVPLEIKKEEINGLTERYLVAIKENNTNDMSKFGRLLYEKLFKPLEKRLKKTRVIIIIPDGRLATIPFESLIIDKKESGQPVFLLEKYRIKYIQSASILSVLRKHYQQDRETRYFIGFGDPVYDYKKFKQEKIEQADLIQSQNGDEIKEIHRTRYARAGGALPRLQGSGEEVKVIARLFEKKHQKCAAHIRDKATEENAKVPEMKDFDFIHFACHGLLNDDFQCLVLSQDIPDAKDDGYFTFNEIMNCDYNAKLVVLSGCETGSGKMERAEGITGLTRAVMYAGTPAVVASLWKVDDTATKKLMVNFYRNLLEKNLSKTEALRQAKLELLKTKHYASPIFWSAFVLYGE